jgi:poly(3-hydroxyoctanoate) depolymerase
MRRTLLLALLLSGCGNGSAPPGSDVDLGFTVDGSDGDLAPPSDLGSRCIETPDLASCAMVMQALSVSPGVARNVYYQVPLGTPPVNGWSVVILFQGSLFSPALTMEATAAEPFGAYYQVVLMKRLLDAGYAVLEPETHLGGDTFWDTNVPPWDVAWSGAPDDLFMQSIFVAIQTGVFGPVDSSHRYATGISSGGYMTSRMAVSYPGMFRALAVASGSYATCSGALCTVPTPLPADHPPTLFLHGDADPVVPLSTMELYRDDLLAEGLTASSIIEAGAGHQWIAPAPDAIRMWFDEWH